MIFMDTGKNELSPEMVEAIREVVKEEIGNAIINQYPFFGMLEAERIFMDEQERLKECPLKGVLGHVTKVTQNDDGQKFDIKLNEQGRQFVNNIYEQQRLKESDLRDTVEGRTEWNDIWNEIYKRGDFRLGESEIDKEEFEEYIKDHNNLADSISTEGCADRAPNGTDKQAGITLES